MNWLIKQISKEEWSPYVDKLTEEKSSGRKE